MQSELGVLREENRRLAEPDDQINTLQAMHIKKTRSLIKTINSLREELDKLKAQSKDHRRSAMIQGVKSQVQAAELKVDVLKQYCMERLSLTP